MSGPTVTVIVPTLHAGGPLRESIASLEGQTFQDFNLVVVDNSGIAAVRRLGIDAARMKIIENPDNIGFGAAINQGIAASSSQFVAVLNDDATAQPRWLEALINSIEQRYEIGMCASKVVLPGEEALDSAGMLLCADGSSKQRGQGKPPSSYSRNEDILMPSGSAALYRRDMLVETGGFDASFFLYCEDTDLGLRARWGGWECRFVPDAVVEHRYSHTAGSASKLKAFYVERNRLYVAAKNFPASMLLRAPLISLVRYYWHWFYATRGRGTAGQFATQNNGPASMFSIVVRAHLDVFSEWKTLRAKRRAIKRRLTPKQFVKLSKSYSISARQVAAL